MPSRSSLVLVVEDEPLIAMTVEELVEQAGLTPHTCRSLPEALEVGRDADLCGAIVDNWLHGLESSELAVILSARGIPFVITTGSEPAETGNAFAGAPILRKPYADAELLGHLQNFAKQP